MIATVRVSQQAKEQLIALKRRTGIAHNNVLCRWALARSLAEGSSPPRTEIVTDSNIEIDWRTFGGSEADIYLGLLSQSARREGRGVDEDSVAEQLRLHLHRGIGYLYGDRNLRSIEQLVKLASTEAA